MSYWNYRVLRVYDAGYDQGYGHKIIEVYYNDDNSIMGWVDDKNFLRWEKLIDLEATVDHIKNAFSKPILIADEQEKLSEVE